MATALLAVIPHNRFLGNVFRHHTEMYWEKITLIYLHGIAPAQSGRHLYCSSHSLIKNKLFNPENKWRATKLDIYWQVIK